MKKSIPIIGVLIGTILLAANFIQFHSALVVIVSSVGILQIETSKFLKKFEKYNYLFFVEILTGTSFIILILLLLLKFIQTKDFWLAITILGIELWILRWLENKKLTPDS